LIAIVIRRVHGLVVPAELVALMLDVVVFVVFVVVVVVFVVRRPHRLRSAAITS